MAMSADERQWIVNIQAYFEHKLGEHEKQMANLLAILAQIKTEITILVPKIQPALTMAEEVVSELHLTTAEEILAAVQSLASLVEAASPSAPATVAPAETAPVAVPVEPPAPAAVAAPVVAAPVPVPAPVPAPVNPLAPAVAPPK